MRRIGALAAGILTASTLATTGFSQLITNVIDGFDPSGANGNVYSAGQINNLWMNWFGSAFQSLSWDPGSDAGSNPGSGSLKINANFNSVSNQFAVYDGLAGINPPVNGAVYTNFQCDIRFAPGSATETSGGIAYFGEVEFGLAVGFAQDYFGGIAVPASNTNWVHVSMQLDVNMDPNLTNIPDVLIHIYGPYFGGASVLNGPSTLWVDNIKFSGPQPVPASCVVNWTNVHQSIDGFGASSAWNSSLTPAQMDMFYSTNTGIGLSLLRTRIAPGGTTVEGSAMQMARDRGARVWSTPWSPAANFKNNNNTTNGAFVGTISNYQAYASQLAGYVVSMSDTYGVNLYAVSVQNEPDAFVTNYESCNWTAQQIHDFVPYLYSALAASNVSATRIMLPESQNWQDYSNLASIAMSDSTSNDVSIIADHNYDGGNGPVSLVKNSYGKTLWETEVSTYDTFDGSINNGIYWAERIHRFMTEAQVNAWSFWWLIPYISTDNEGLTDSLGNPTKRMYALGNYSRFVRPGFVRIGVSNNALPTDVSAYKDPATGNFAIVAINSVTTSYTQTFNLSGFTTPVVTPWVTSGTLSLASQAPVAVSNSTFVYNLPALSVVTFVGQAGTVVPTLAVHVAGTQSTLTIGGPAGGSYTISSSTDLSHWQTLLATNPPVTPVMWVDPNPAVTTRYYRVSLAQ
jgi:glucuronoarabinoxylan endo-1,4-beta-xylanase